MGVYQWIFYFFPTASSCPLQSIGTSSFTKNLEIPVTSKSLSLPPKLTEHKWNKNYVVLLEGYQAAFSKIRRFSKVILHIIDKNMPFWFVLTLFKVVKESKLSYPWLMMYDLVTFCNEFHIPITPKLPILVDFRPIPLFIILDSLQLEGEK